MNLQIFDAECGNCGQKFKTKELKGNRYGDFLMRSAKGDVAYLYAINDSVFDEFSLLLNQHPEISKMNDTQQAHILHKTFGYACDLSNNDSQFDITQRPICPNCKVSQLIYWSPTIPPEFIDINITPVTYKKWIASSEEEKRQIIDSALHEKNII